MESQCVSVIDDIKIRRGSSFRNHPWTLRWCLWWWRMIVCSLQHKIYVHRNLGSKPIIISDQRLISKNPMPISDLIIVPEVIESGLRGQPSDFNLDLDGQDREMSKDGIHVHSVVSSFKESGGEPQDLTTKKKLLGISQNQIRSISQEIQFCL